MRPRTRRRHSIRRRRCGRRAPTSHTMVVAYIMVKRFHIAHPLLRNLLVFGVLSCVGGAEGLVCFAEDGAADGFAHAVDAFDAGFDLFAN